MPRTNREPAHPTLRGQWLGHQLRELRLQRGLTLEDAAAYLGIDRSGLARFERAEWPFKRDHVLALLDHYRVWDPEQRSRLLRQQEEAWRIDIFDTELTGSIHGDNSLGLSWLEGQAELICVYAALVLPGLLQTPEFAGAVMRFYGNPESQIDRWVELRMARQRVLDGPKAPRFSTVIDQMALRHPVGEAPVMRNQLEHLIAASRRPNIEVLVVPSEVPRLEGALGQFTLLQMPKPYSSVAYLENLAGRFYLESPKSKRFINAYGYLRKAALPPDESTELITRIAKEWT